VGRQPEVHVDPARADHHAAVRQQQVGHREELSHREHDAAGRGDEPGRAQVPLPLELIDGELARAHEVGERLQQGSEGRDPYEHEQQPVHGVEHRQREQVEADVEPEDRVGDVDGGLVREEQEPPPGQRTPHRTGRASGHEQHPPHRSGAYGDGERRHQRHRRERRADGAGSLGRDEGPQSRREAERAVPQQVGGERHEPEEGERSHREDRPDHHRDGALPLDAADGQPPAAEQGEGEDGQVQGISRGSPSGDRPRRTRMGRGWGAGPPSREDQRCVSSGGFSICSHTRSRSPSMRERVRSARKRGQIGAGAT